MESMLTHRAPRGVREVGVGVQVLLDGADLPRSVWRLGSLPVSQWCDTAKYRCTVAAIAYTSCRAYVIIPYGVWRVS